MRLSILVPVFNEETTVASIMNTLADVLPYAQIIYVDDGSRDRSLEILKTNSRPQDIVLTKENGGKGSAIRIGLQEAKGEFTIIQDADLEYNPREIHILLDEAITKNISAVFGSRFLKSNPNIYKRFLLGNKMMTLVCNLLFGGKLTDSYTCYKLLKTDLFRSLDLQSSGFEMEAEICCKCLKKGIQIAEVPVSYSPRRIEEGKKICLRDAWKGVLMMIKIYFSAS